MSRADTVLDTFLDHRDWGRTVTVSEFENIREGYDRHARPALWIEQTVAGDFEMSFRLFNLFTLTVYDYETVLEFLGNYCTPGEFTEAHREMGVGDWRAIKVEEATGYSPIIKQEGLEAVALMWESASPMRVNNPTRFVSAYQQVMRKNAYSVSGLEVGPMAPYGRAVFRGEGEPFRLVSE